MHLTSDVSIANLITWALAGLGFAFGAGALVGKLEELRADLNVLVARLDKHIEEDTRRFDAMQAQIYELIRRDRAA